MKQTTNWIGCVLGLLISTAPAVLSAELPPLTQLHAHNDYEHARPLMDALSHGICSVEADVFLVNGKLLVAHEMQNVKPEKTLEALYLIPLQNRVRTNRGYVYPVPSDFTLLIDLKSDGLKTYAALEPVLEKYRQMLTEFTPSSTTKRAIRIIITGNVPRAFIMAEKNRLASIDGTLSDIDSSVSADIMPWISDDWLAKFNWFGVGELSAEKMFELRKMVVKAHLRGRQIRFWNTPNTINFWKTEREAGIDLLNVDDLQRAETFIRTEHAIPNGLPE